MNKACYWLVIICCMSCVHHTNSDVEKILDAAEDMLPVHPDNAFVALEQYKSDVASWKSADQARFWMDYVDAKNKSYVLLDEQAELEKAVKYYEKAGDNSRLAKCYYLLGCVLRDQNDGVAAMETWQKGVDCSNHHVPPLCNELSLLYYQMAKMAECQYNFTDAQEYNDSSYFYAAIIGDTLLMMNSYIAQTGVLLCCGKTDSLIERTEWTRGVLIRHHAEQRAAMCCFNAVLYLIEQGNDSLADDYLTIYEREEECVDSSFHVVYGDGIYYYAKGMCLLHRGKTEEAKLFFRRELSISYNN